MGHMRRRIPRAVANLYAGLLLANISVSQVHAQSTPRTELQLTLRAAEPFGVPRSSGEKRRYTLLIAGGAVLVGSYAVTALTGLFFVLRGNLEYVAAGGEADGGHCRLCAEGGRLAIPLVGAWMAVESGEPIGVAPAVILGTAQALGLVTLVVGLAQWSSSGRRLRSGRAAAWPRWALAPGRDGGAITLRWEL